MEGWYIQHKQDVNMGGGGNNEFQWYTKQNSYTKDGILYIRPTFTADAIGEGPMISGGTIDLFGDGCVVPDFCTSSSCCRKTSNGKDIIPPIQSGLLRTKESFSIKYGKVEVNARLPRGDFLWPAIWMLPKDNKYGSWPASGEIDIMESRGNTDGAEGLDYFSSTLHWAPHFFADGWSQTHSVNKALTGNFNDEFHIFGLEWTDTFIKTYIDTPDNVVLNVPFNKGFYDKGAFPPYFPNPWENGEIGAPFDQEFYLILNLAVGGNQDFDPGTNGYFANSANSALDFWKKKDQWMPSWPNDERRSLAVDWVKIWKRC